MHVHTRIKEKVDVFLNPELQCTICREWQPAAQFQVKNDRAAGKLRYESKCLSCKKAANTLWNRGGHTRYPTKDEIVALLQLPLSFAASLNQARHGHTSPVKPLSTAAREELRERREEAEGKPSMCYLVGMRGDDSAVKIGHSTNVYRRMAQYQAGNPRKLVVLAQLPGGQEKERELHQKFIAYHSDEFVGEWFRKAPAIMNEFSAGRVRGG